MTAQRFRAYESIRTTRTRQDNDGKDVEYECDASGHVFLAGDVPSSGIVQIDAGRTMIRRVAFYSGDVEDEVCLGSVLLNAGGNYSVNAADAK